MIPVEINLKLNNIYNLNQQDTQQMIYRRVEQQMQKACRLVLNYILPLHCRAHLITVDNIMLLYYRETVDAHY